MPKKVGTRANKAKGRKLQKDVVDFILKFFRTLTKDDVRSTPMGMTGSQLNEWQQAKKLLPLSIECKNQENRGFSGVYRCYEQAETHYENLEPVGIIKMNGKKPLAIVSPEYLFQLQSKVVYLVDNKKETKSSNGHLGNFGIVPLGFSTTVDSQL